MVTRVCSGPSAKRYRLQGNITTHTPKDYVDVFKHHKVNRAVVLCAVVLCAYWPSTPSTATSQIRIPSIPSVLGLLLCLLACVGREGCVCTAFLLLCVYASLLFSTRHVSKRTRVHAFAYALAHIYVLPDAHGHPHSNISRVCCMHTFLS